MQKNILHKQLIEKPHGDGSAPTTPQPPPTPRIVGDASSVGGGARQRWLTLATDAVDRAGDILVLEGMDAENFLKNPQFLWQHGASGETISTIGRVLDLRVGRASSPGGRAGGTDLRALVEYAAPEVSPLAEKIYRMDLAGLLPANSIGFRPIEYEANEFGGYTFTRWELIECSKVELPMNPEAVDSEKSLVLSPELAAEWLLS